MKVEHEEKLSQANSQNAETLGQAKAHLAETLERIVAENDQKIAKKDEAIAQLCAYIEKLQSVTQSEQVVPQTVVNALSPDSENLSEARTKITALEAKLRVLECQLIDANAVKARNDLLVSLPKSVSLDQIKVRHRPNNGSPFDGREFCAGRINEIKEII